MNIINRCVFTMFLCAALSVAQAENDQTTSIGVGNYAIAATFTNPYFPDMDFTGHSLFISHAASDASVIRLGLFQAEDVDYYVETQGLDVQFLFGANLNGEGLKLYFGPGFFSETVKENLSGYGFSGDISGFQLVGGIGVNAGNISIDLTVNARDSGAYNDFMSDITGGSSIEAFDTVVSAALVVSARF